MGADLQLFDGNIHDPLATCAVTVLANSAAALEAFLHRKPASLFGQSGFENPVSRAHRPEDFPVALDKVLGTDWRFAKMLHWYFTRQAL